MAQSLQFTLAVDPALPADQREALIAAFESNNITLRETQSRHPASAWLIFLRIIGGVGVVADSIKKVADAAKSSAEAGNEAVKLAEAIKKWRADSRAARVKPAARLEAPGRQPLDLATASDAAVLAWLLDEDLDADSERGRRGEGEMI